MKLNINLRDANINLLDVNIQHLTRLNCEVYTHNSNIQQAWFQYSVFNSSGSRGSTSHQPSVLSRHRPSDRLTDPSGSRSQPQLIPALSIHPSDPTGIADFSQYPAAAQGCLGCFPGCWKFPTRHSFQTCSLKRAHRSLPETPIKITENYFSLRSDLPTTKQNVDLPSR